MKRKKENQFGAKVRSLRTEKKLSLKKLSKKLRIDRAHLSRIESGKIIPSEKLLYRISKLLYCDYEELSILSGKLPSDIKEIFMSFPKEASSLIRSRFPENMNGINETDGHNGIPPHLKKYRLIDLFSGAGGLTRGFTDTGRFVSVFANDFNEWSVRTYNRNFGEHCRLGDINDFLESPNFIFPKADVVVGGPPCQGFSLLNKNRENDPRKQLWLAYMEVIKRVQPLAFVMENVTELRASDEFALIKQTASSMGYKMIDDILNAADYGVPQRRRRTILIGVRKGAPVLPAPTHYNPGKITPVDDLYLKPWKSVREAIGDLPNPVGTELRHGEVPPPMDLHFGRNPTAKSIARYKCIPEGGNRFDLLNKRRDLTPPCWIRKKSGGTDLFGRLWWNKPAFTIRTEFFKPEKGRYLHPSQHRPITHREAARLQSFPDDFVFTGSKTEIAIQIGNAVPPLLAKRVAESLLETLDANAASHRRTLDYASV